jgi:hypothetical protein
VALIGETYWLTYRIADDGHFAYRLNQLKRAIAAASEGPVWEEPTSFALIRSRLPLDALAAQLAAALRVDRDFVLIGMPYRKAARIIGHWSDDRVRQLMPFTEMV